MCDQVMFKKITDLNDKLSKDLIDAKDALDAVLKMEEEINRLREIEQPLPCKSGEDFTLYTGSRHVVLFEQLVRNIADTTSHSDLSTGGPSPSSLSSTKSIAITRGAIYGLGGVGKTELANQYWRKYKKHYPGGVFWINAESLESTNNSVKHCLQEHLYESIASNDDMDTIRAKFLRNLKTRLLDGLRTLIIFDNADKDVSFLHKYIPVINWKPILAKGDDPDRDVSTATDCHVIVTSRQSNAALTKVFGDNIECFKIESLSEDEAIEYLWKYRSGDSSITSAEAYLSKYPEKCKDLILKDEVRSTQKLARLLGYHPLALKQVACYMMENEGVHIGFTTYLPEFKSKLRAVRQDKKKRDETGDDKVTQDETEAIQQSS